MTGIPGVTFRRRTYRSTSRPMTAAEEKAFDKVFQKMGETFEAVDNLFETVFPDDGSPPPHPGSQSNEGAKGSNQDG